MGFLLTIVRLFIVGSLWVGPQLCLADEAWLLSSKADAFEARRMLIEEAKGPIYASYFLAREDEAAHLHFALLREHVRATGQPVRVILDWFQNSLSSDYLGYLQEVGIEVRFYHSPFGRSLLDLPFRNHTKVLTNGMAVIAGDRNIAEAYFEQGPKRSTLSIDVMIKGESGAAAHQYLAEFWKSDKLVPALSPGAKSKNPEIHQSRLDQALDWYRYIRSEAPNHFRLPPAISVRAEFVADDVSPIVVRDRSFERMQWILSGAKRYAAIVAPYFVPNEEFVFLLKGLGERVKVITNSFRSTNWALVHAGYLSHKGDLLRAGVSIFEYPGPELLHAKIVRVDEDISYVGSFQPHARASRFDLESGLLVWSEEFAQELDHVINDRLGSSPPAPVRFSRPIEACVETLARWFRNMTANQLNGTRGLFPDVRN